MNKTENLHRPKHPQEQLLLNPKGINDSIYYYY